MPKLDEVLDMFEKFGMPRDYVRQAMAVGESAFNAFEGLKSVLLLQWEEMPVSQQQELKPTYDRLMRISMKSRTMSEDQPILNLLDDLKESIDQVRPWALVLRDIVEDESVEHCDDLLRKSCTRRGIDLPPPDMAVKLLATACKYRVQEGKCPKE